MPKAHSIGIRFLFDRTHMALMATSSCNYTRGCSTPSLPLFMACMPTVLQGYHVLVSNHTTSGDLMCLFELPQRYTHLITTAMPGGCD